MVNSNLKVNKNKFFKYYPSGGLILFLVFIFSYSLLRDTEIPIFHLLLGLTLVYLVGLIDDYKDLRLRNKILLQLVAVFYLCYFGIRVSFITNPIDGFFYLESFSIPITIIWVLLLVNMFNLLEGIKDLAIGVANISSIIIWLIAWDLGRNDTAILALLITVVLTFFNICNKYFNKNYRLGNSGSMLLGAIMAIITISGALKSVTFISLLLPLLIVGVPILNGLVGLYNVITTKQTNNQIRVKLLHHLFLNWGLTEGQSRMAFYFLSVIFGMLAFLLIKITTTQSLIIILLILFFLVLVLHGLRSGELRNKRLENVKLLKDIQLNLYQIKDIVRTRKINGDIKVVKQELDELGSVIINKIPIYIKEIVDESAITQAEDLSINEQIDDTINIIEEVINTYSNELENLDYILKEYKEDLKETVEILDKLYIKLK
ncbi:MAG: MraY family glycosyltransferase [Nanoarchaeota archaeon]